MSSVDLQQSNRRSPFVRRAGQHWAIPDKVVVPIVDSWIEQKGFVTGLGINSGDIWPFVIVALKTRKAQILLDGVPVHLLGNDMVDLKRCRVEVLRHLAVFASVPRSLPYDPS